MNSPSRELVNIYHSLERNPRVPRLMVFSSWWVNAPIVLFIVALGIYKSFPRSSKPAKVAWGVIAILFLITGGLMCAAFSKYQDKAHVLTCAHKNSPFQKTLKRAKEKKKSQKSWPFSVPTSKTHTLTRFSIKFPLEKFHETAVSLLLVTTTTVLPPPPTCAGQTQCQTSSIAQLWGSSLHDSY